VRTSSIFVMIFAFPPRGMVNLLPQALHVTGLVAHPKIICVLLHSEHDTRRKRDLGFGNTSFSFIHTNSNLFNLNPFLGVLCPHCLQVAIGRVFLLTFAFRWNIWRGNDP